MAWESTEQVTLLRLSPASWDVAHNLFRLPKRPDLMQRRAPIGYRAAPGSPLGAGPTPIPDSPSMPSGGAGLYSTANDYAKVLVALLSGGGGLPKPESVQ
jgi:hypothetical protein